MRLRVRGCCCGDLTATTPHRNGRMGKRRAPSTRSFGLLACQVLALALVVWMALVLGLLLLLLPATDPLATVVPVKKALPPAPPPSTRPAINPQPPAMSRASPIVIPALRKHTATIFILHGLGDSGAGREPVARLLAPKLPHVKWILPHA